MLDSMLSRSAFVAEGNPMKNNMFLFTAPDKIDQDQVLNCILFSLKNDRHVHVNTGTFGCRDGSTNFYMTKKTREKMQKKDIS